jgi:hypothetical protein
VINHLRVFSFRFLREDESIGFIENFYWEFILLFILKINTSGPIFMPAGYSAIHEELHLVEISFHVPLIRYYPNLAEMHMSINIPPKIQNIFLRMQETSKRKHLKLLVAPETRFKSPPEEIPNDYTSYRAAAIRFISSWLQT